MEHDYREKLKGAVAGLKPAESTQEAAPLNGLFCL
jgi:hypothetical protein